MPDKVDINAALGLQKGLHFGLRFDKTPDVLYHYTSLAGMLGILRTNRIWATDARYLNDVNESRQIWLVLERYVRELMRRGEGRGKLDLDQLLRSIHSFEHSISFIASFSEARDMLSQWRAYSGAGPGICIAFAAEALRTQWIFNPKGEPHWTGMQFQKVDYIAESDPALKAALEDLLNGSRDPFMKGMFSAGAPMRPEDEIVLMLSLFAARFKSAAFSEEQEWRLSFQRVRKPMRHQQFRVSGSMLVPYIEAELNKGSKNLTLVEGEYIKEIIVGPSAHKDLNIEAVRQFLNSIGLTDVPVTASEAPYRNW